MHYSNSVTPLTLCIMDLQMVFDRFPGGQRQTPPTPTQNVAVHLGDLLQTPSPGMWGLKLGSKKQWPAENNCLHRLTSYKD